MGLFFYQSLGVNTEDYCCLEKLLGLYLTLLCESIIKNLSEFEGLECKGWGEAQ
jgi:hypothetical protein